MRPSAPTFTLDGHPLPCAAGQTVITIAAGAGIDIPHLCHHPDVSPHGSCRVCTVSVNGHLQPACTTQPQPGDVVAHRTPALQQMRLRLVQLLFIEGNHCCPACEHSGHCRLQAVAYQLGMTDLHFAPQFPLRRLDASHPDLLLDRDRCIQCALCVRASHELDGKAVFALAGRGQHTTLVVNSASGLLGDTDLLATDHAANVCPVGAILHKRRAFRVPIGERPSDLPATGSTLPEPP